MTKTKSTKRSLLMSALALLVCVSMLIGSTFAWFTDSVTSAGNIIKSGSLDVTMEWADGTKAVPADDSTDWKDGSQGAIFDYDLWEPGYTEVRHIKIANEGTLALKYQLNILANGEVSELADVIDVYYLDPADQVADRTALTAGKKLGTLTQVLANISTTASGNLLAGEKHTVTLALKMQESAGNKYQDKAIGSNFTVQLLATQLTAEEDSFDDQYDKFADYDGEISNAVSLAAALTNGGTYKVTNDVALDAYVTVPAGVTVALDLNGKTISAASGNVIRNNGKLTVANGTLQGTTTYTINNESATGSVTVENVKSVNGGFFNAGSMVVNNCEITNTASGKHALYNAGTLVVNGGTYSTTAGNAILMSGSGTIEVNDGSFTQIGSSYMIDGSGITINGGTFTDDDGKWAIRGTHTITGGTFNFDPTAWVADGYAAVKNENGSYIVYGAGDTMTVADDAVLDLGGVAFPGKIVAEGDLTIKGDTSIKTLAASNGGTITIEEGKTLTLNNFSFGNKNNADATYVITGGNMEAKYGFFQHGTFELRGTLETDYMYYSYGSDVTVYGTVHSKGMGDGLDYVRGKVTIANGGKSVHDRSLWVGQPTNWGAMSATLIVEEGGYVEANSLTVHPGSSLLIDAQNLQAGEVGSVVCNTLTNSGTVEAINNDALNATVSGNKIVLSAKAWDGSVVDSLTKSDDGKYHITSGAQLAYLNTVLKGMPEQEGIKVVLDADIDLGNKDWTPIGNLDECAFQGQFDGNGHTIKNVKVVATKVDGDNNHNAGLFGVAKYGYTKISNLTVENIVISGESERVGGIVGMMNGGTIENCNVIKADIQIGEKVGGIVGDLCGAAMNNCTITESNLVSEKYAGALTARTREDGSDVSISGCTATNCTVTGADGYVGELVGTQIVAVSLDDSTATNVTVTKK